MSHPFRKVSGSEGGIGVGVCVKTSGVAVGPQAVASSKSAATDSVNKCFLIGLPPFAGSGITDYVL
jgi:hypothetical protein